MTQIAALTVPPVVLLTPDTLDRVATEYNVDAQAPNPVEVAQKKMQRDTVIAFLVILAVGVVLASRGHLNK